MDATGEDTPYNVLEAITLRNQSASSLLRLPVELRNQIYNHVFYGATINVCYCHTSQRFKEKLQPSILSTESSTTSQFDRTRQLLCLLEVSRQVYAETRLMVFGALQLQGNCDDVSRFLSPSLDRKLAADQISAIRAIDFFTICRVRKFGNTEAEDLTFLAQLPGLERIVLRTVSLSLVDPDGTDFEICVAQFRQEVMDASKQHGRTIKVEHIEYRSEKFIGKGKECCWVLKFYKRQESSSGDKYQHAFQSCIWPRDG